MKNPKDLVEIEFACNSAGKAKSSEISMERSTSLAQDFNRLVPLPIVIVTKVVGLPCRALLDSSSLGDFISTTLVDQLQLATFELEKPITLHMACQGSRDRKSVV